MASSRPMWVTDASGRYSINNGMMSLRGAWPMVRVAKDVIIVISSGFAGDASFRTATTTVDIRRHQTTDSCRDQILLPLRRQILPPARCLLHGLRPFHSPARSEERRVG